MLYMAPDLAIASNEDDNTPDEPDSPKASFRSRIATSKHPLTPQTGALDKSLGNTKGGNTKSSVPTPFTSTSKPVSIPAKRKPEQASETRDKLQPFHTSPSERRTSVSRSRAKSTGGSVSSKKPHIPRGKRSAPDMRTTSGDGTTLVEDIAVPPVDLSKLTLEDRLAKPNAVLPDVAPPLLSPRSSLDDERLSRHSSHVSDGLNDPAFWQELESRWILNLSMAFRDNSEREKFFITYAEEPNRWRRVTVSVDYRNKPPDSLEADLKTLPFQRDKSAHIYEAVHESLSNVQFFDSVTNLRLETSDGRLHVHVTKDENEIIKYPPIDAVEHLELGIQHEVLESDIHFQSHLSGFVYKVSVNGKSFIKKEIPGPDMIDEFLYEVNALWHLRESPHVIEFCAIVLDDERTCIKGLLISYAERGTLVDIIYDNRDPPLPWARRDKWAQQIVSGLKDIHEHGFVQGDFTLSNIVIENNDNAQIIDINRRGCPVGWEPPEFQGLIGSGQRISMYIGTKSDLFQLGMVLWAIAELDDEPERAVDTLTLENTQSGAPAYLIDWVSSCFETNPRDRLSAKDMLAQLTTVPMDPVKKPPRAADVNSRRSLFDTSKGRVANAQQTFPQSHEHEIQYEDGDVVTTTQTHALHALKGRNQSKVSRQHSLGPIQHQDSGLPGMDHEVAHLGPPLHQDSGFGDAFLGAIEGSEDGSHGGRLRRGVQDINFVGGQFG